MTNRVVVVWGAFVCAFWMSNAFAAEEGFFLGAGAGQSTMKAESDNDAGVPKIKLDESDNAYKFYGGLNFTKWFGIEGGYIELGNQNQSESFPSSSLGPTTPTRVEAEVSANGWQGFGVLYLPIGNFDLFAKVGGIAANIDVETKVHCPDRPPGTSTTARAKATA